MRIVTPFFSIITPSLNGLTDLSVTAETVFSQSSKLFEYIVVDGGSTDGTVPWLENNRNRINWISEADRSVYDAINKGIAVARGKYIYIIGAGDVLRSGILEQAQAFILELSSDGPHFIYGSVCLLGHESFILGGLFDKARLSFQNVCHQGIFYEKSIFDLLGPYELKYPLYSDWAFNIRCFGDNRIVKKFWPATVANYKGGGLSDSCQDFQFAADHSGLIRENFGSLFAMRFRLISEWRKRLSLLRGFMQKSIRE